MTIQSVSQSFWLFDDELVVFLIFAAMLAPFDV